MFVNKQLEVEDLPKVEELDFKSIDKRYFYVLCINLFLMHLLLFLLLTGLQFFYGDVINSSAFYWVALLLIIALFFFQVLVYYLGFKLREYALRERDITYRQGLIVYKQTTLPFNRIQHVEIERSFLAKYFGLSTLNIYTAGESGSDLSIKGLPKDDAAQINAFLLKLLADRDAV